MGEQISILLFADDIALISFSEEKLQIVLNCVYDWCSKWRLKLNEEKTQIVHFRPLSGEITAHQSKYRDKDIVVTCSYKYLGFWLHENRGHGKGTNELAKAASRALGVLVTKFRSCGNM